jgi:phage terminase large subunit-like protein
MGLEPKVRAPFLDAVAGNPLYIWAIRAWDVAAAIDGNWFDVHLADRTVKLWPSLFCHTEGRWAGKPFVLALWQEIIVRLLVGWRNTEGFRHFRRMILWVARKNGKSEFMAALALLFFVGDGERGGQAFNFARNEKQAAVIFKKAKAMIAMSPSLRDALKATKRTIFHPELNALWELLAGNAEGKHGLSASVIVADEAHECPDDTMYTTLHQSTAARDQPIELIGSTAGHRNRGWGWTLWEECRAILEGRLLQPESLVVVFAAPADAALDDETAWAAANPNLGISPKLEYLRAECAKAKENPRLENDFRRYHLNQWTDQVTRWIPMAKWDACAPDKSAWMALRERLKGRTCFAALDLSSVKDVTALIYLFPPEEPDAKWQIVCRFFVPEESAHERSRADRVDYDRWIAQGAMEATPGDVVDQEFVKKAILADGAFFKVVQLGVDPWNATKLNTELLDEGVPVINMRQGIQTLGGPSKEFERMVYAGGVNVGPVTAQQSSAVFACVQVRSQDIAKLPVILYQRTADGGRRRATEHPLYNLVGSRPNSRQTSFEWREMMQATLDLRGNAYSRIIRDGRQRPIELIPLHDDWVRP